MCGLGLAFYEQLGFVTSGIAGLALVLSYLSGFEAGLLFFVLNLPFYGLAITRMGWYFTLRSFAAVAVLSVVIEVQPSLIDLSRLDPLYGAIIAGVITGFGLLGIFRHLASLGGVGILAIYLQDCFNFRAGLTQLALDTLIFALAFAAVSPGQVALSFVGAVVLNLFLAVNHRSDRYIAR